MRRYDVHIVKYKNVPFGYNSYGIMQYRVKPYVKRIKVYADSEEEAIKQLEDEGHDVVRKGDDNETTHK